MNKLEITYIGNKAIKKDTVTGSRLVFPRNKSVAVESDIAHRLLEYPKVWVLSEEAKDIVAANEAKEKAIAEQKEAEALLAKQEEANNSYVVKIDGEDVDLNKLNSNQLKTLVEAQDLTISVNQKPVAEYRSAIREALLAKQEAEQD
jgi:tRNA pseudouridine-54 N-methylase